MQGPANFATTRWSLVQQLDSESDGTAALQELCQTYWRPIYNFVRLSGFDSSTAQDVTQSFFAHILKNHTLSRADENRGRFRTFLLHALKNFITDFRRKEAATKRGGGVEFIEFDESEIAQSLDPSTPPDLSFERTWAASVMRVSLNRINEEFKRAGRTRRLELIKPYLLSDAPPGRYTEIADELAINESTLRSAVLRMRQRFQLIFRQEVAETVRDESEVNAEIRHLLGVL